MSGMPLTSAATFSRGVASLQCVGISRVGVQVCKTSKWLRGEGSPVRNGRQNFVRRGGRNAALQTFRLGEVNCARLYVEPKL